MFYVYRLKCTRTCLPVFTKKWFFCYIFGPHSHPPAPIEVKFCTAKRPAFPSAVPSLTWIGATSHPCGAKNLIFGLWVNLIPAVCRFAAILPVNRNQKHSASKAMQYRHKANCCATSIESTAMSIVTMRSIWRKVCYRLFAFWKFSTANLRILWRHLPMEVRNV